MNAVILSCSNLAVYVKAAQETCGTDYPVVFLDQTNHVEPSRMRKHIIETGVYDCYDLDFVETVQADADRIHADIDYIPGSNLLLEKLVSGRWDRQFLVLEPGKPVTQSAIFDD